MNIWANTILKTWTPKTKNLNLFIELNLVKSVSNRVEVAKKTKGVGRALIHRSGYFFGFEVHGGRHRCILLGRFVLG